MCTRMYVYFNLLLFFYFRVHGVSTLHITTAVPVTHNTHTLNAPLTILPRQRHDLSVGLFLGEAPEQ